MTRVFRVLVVEDNEADAELAKRALRKVSGPVDVEAVADGDEALTWLRDRARERRPLPDVVLLDLNMPRMSGHEVLTALRGDPVLSLLPVVVFSSSANPDDVKRAYQSHANPYVTKPNDFTGYKSVMATLHDYWRQTATLPDC